MKEEKPLLPEEPPIEVIHLGKVHDYDLLLFGLCSTLAVLLMFLGGLML